VCGTLQGQECQQARIIGGHLGDWLSLYGNYGSSLLCPFQTFPNLGLFPNKNVLKAVYTQILLLLTFSLSEPSLRPEDKVLGLSRSFRTDSEHILEQFFLLTSLGT
jgi:hypothetical protein